MPPITLLGWVHTIVAIVGIVAGFYTLAIFKVITPEHRPGRIYLLCTLVAAVTALMIYHQGGFGPAHVLAVLTLLALLGGIVVTRIAVLSRIAAYLQALFFSGTLLFHMIPAITDGLRRLPVGDPIVNRFDDPLLRGFYLLFLGLFVIGYGAQVLWLTRGARVARANP